MPGYDSPHHVRLILYMKWGRFLAYLRKLVKAEAAPACVPPQGLEPGSGPTNSATSAGIVGDPRRGVGPSEPTPLTLEDETAHAGSAHPSPGAEHVEDNPRFRQNPGPGAFGLAQVVCGACDAPL